MITDTNRKKIYNELNREHLADYWGGYFHYERNGSDLQAITERELRREIAICRNDERPYIDSKVVVGRVLTTLGSQHNFHRQFNERFPDLHREQILGMQLYSIMLHDPEVWIYTETTHLGHLFPNAAYFLPQS